MPLMENLQGTRSINNKVQSHYNSILVMSSTCHLRELNPGGEDNIHSSQPHELNPIDNEALMSTLPM
jgi:hypothetical protein